jgi:hypothetical protein
MFPIPPVFSFWLSRFRSLLSFFTSIAHKNRKVKTWSKGGAA